MTEAFKHWSVIHAFLAQGGADSEGRTLRDYRKFTDVEMESEHHYIQWMFPTDKKSAFNPSAPLIENDFFGNRDMVAPVLRSVLQFTGFLARNQHWRTPGDHNILRISRMLRSVKLICGDEAALDLLAMVCEFRSDAEDNKAVMWFSTHAGPVVIFWIAALFDGKLETVSTVYNDWIHPSNVHISLDTIVRRHINQRKEAA